MVDRAPPDTAALVHCPFCQVIMANDGTMAGTLARCPTCRNHFVMPSLAPVAQYVALDSPARVTQPIQQPLPAGSEVPAAPAMLPAVSPAKMPAPHVAAEHPALVPAVVPAANLAGVAPAIVQAATAAGLPIIDFAPGFHPEHKPAKLAPAPQIAPQALAPQAAPQALAPAPQVAPNPGPAPAPTVSPVQVVPAVSPVSQVSTPVCTPALPMAKPMAPPVSPGFGKLGFHPGPAPAAAPVPPPTLAPATPATANPGSLPAGMLVGLPPAPPAEPPADPAAVAAMQETPEPTPSAADRAVQAAPAWLVSAVIHAVFVILLGMWVIVSQPEILPMLVDINWSKELGEQLDRTVELKTEQPDPVDPIFSEKEVAVPVEEPAMASLPEVVPAIDGSTLVVPAVAGPGSLQGRGDDKRAELVAAFGGSKESEEAVALGLKWLKEHQNNDGSWSFRHATCPRCNGKCRHNGVIGSPTGATAMALLPFLGAGQSHREGRYQDTVRKGLYYLVNQIKKSTPRGRASAKLGGDGAEGDLQGPGGNMYCHGLASIALCEAYGLTQDGGLRDAAQQTLDFIVYAQDKDGGGWRYSPGDRGDTSVVGWQLMALKSGHMAYLKVPPATINKAIGFLDSVQADGGSVYGYTSPGQGGATTAIGLLCRMYLGWKRDNPALERGVTALSEEGPSKDDMYYNYYATQVLHHYGGEEWKKWNSVMRDQLVKTQGKQGHEEGSWWSPHPWNATGGRLYQTSLSIMTLEVYYRHLPIYRDESVTREFKGR